MLNRNDLYRFAVATPLGSVGQSLIQYEVQRYRDVRNLSNQLAYIVHCVHRVIIPNGTPSTVGPQSSTQYVNYPAAITNNISAEVSGGTNINLQLLRIFPQTINAAVDTSLSNQSSTASTTSRQTTVGSSTAEANTFGVSISGGFFGDLPLGQLTVDYQNMWQSEHSQSETVGSDRQRQSSTVAGESMSIKDWACYSYINSQDSQSSWAWGQAYPWDVIQYNYCPNGANVTLPSFVASRMIDTVNSVLLPPSQLSMFGVDFTMKSSWLVAFPDGVTEPESIILAHETGYFTASHTLNQGGGGSPPTVTATLSSSSNILFSSPPIDLSVYALDPITSLESSNGAVIGFAANPFTFGPTLSGGFKIISPANNLQASGTGFESGMIANLTSSSANATLVIKFKIIDTVNDYALVFKHWISQGSGACKLTVTVNSAPAIQLFADAIYGQGGQNNISSIDLRNTDFSDANYHDYLVLGLNTINVTIEPADQGADASYTLFALAVGAG